MSPTRLLVRENRLPILNVLRSQGLTLTCDVNAAVNRVSTVQ